MALSPTEQAEWLSTDNHRIVLMDLTYYDDSHVEQVARFASYPYVQPIGDVWDTFSNLIYDDIIVNVPNIVTRIDADSTIGAIDLLNTDGEFDDFLDIYTLPGHPIQLSIGGENWIRGDFILILDGIVESVSSSSPENITITLRDRKENLNVVAQPQLYIETGTYNNVEWGALTDPQKAATDEYWHKLMDAAEASGSFSEPLEGNDAPYDRDLAVLPSTVNNTHVPVCLGKCFNIEPELVDSWNHIYHIHDSLEGITAINEVRANGVPLRQPPGEDIYGMELTSYWGGSGGNFLIGERIQDNNDSRYSGIVTGYRGDFIDPLDPYTLLYIPDNLSFIFYSGSGRFQGLTSGVRADAVNSVLEPSNGSQYEIDLDLGLIRLLDHDGGTQITCDVEGQNGLSTLRDGGAPTDLVKHSAAYILEWLLLEKADIPPTDICYETFSPTGSNPFPNTDELGMFYRNGTTVLDISTRVINSVGGFMRFKSAICKLQLYILKEPLGESEDFSLYPDDIIENGISVVGIEEPKKSITLGYKKNWKTQDEGSLAGMLTDSTSPHYDLSVLNSFMHEYSTEYQETGLDPAEYPLAEDMELVETTIWDIDDADAELTRRIGLRDQRRQIIRINSLATSFTYDIGDIVKVYHPRFGLDFGRTAIIIGMEESPTSKRVNLDVWL